MTASHRDGIEEYRMASEVRNVTYNPAYGAFDHICHEQGKAGFALVRVISMGPYEAVAVFERRTPAPPTDGDERPAPEPFTATYEVTLAVADRHATAGFRGPYTPDTLLRWLTGLINGSRPLGVEPTVCWKDDDLAPF